jgi:predicted nuclease of predicted toxin-antitoxin system
MKLLFDQNLSPRLVHRLADLYPNAIHVSLVALDRASDEQVWNYAHENNFIIVTKDADFMDLGVLRGFPPKVIWLRLGNCTTGQIEAALRNQCAAVEGFAANPDAAVLTIF